MDMVKIPQFVVMTFGVKELYHALEATVYKGLQAV